MPTLTLEEMERDAYQRGDYRAVEFLGAAIDINSQYFDLEKQLDCAEGDVSRLEDELADAEHDLDTIKDDVLAALPDNLRKATKADLIAALEKIEGIVT